MGKDHPEEFEEDPERPPEGTAVAKERMELCSTSTEMVMYARSSGTPLPHGVVLTSAERGNPTREWADQSANQIEF